MNNLLLIDKIILETLNKRVDKWTSKYTLMEMVRYNSIGGGRPNELEIRQAIQRLRAFGQPIIAGNKGYMLTTSTARLRLYCLQRRVEINKELSTLQAMELKRENYIKELGK